MRKEQRFIRFWTTQVCIIGIFFTSPALLAAQSMPETAGWHQIPNAKIENVCAATNGFPELGGGCGGVFAWSSGVFDTRRNRQIVWGGGHTDYYGNEIYAFDLDDMTMQRITNPGIPLANPAICEEAIVNGTQPNSRHTYDGLVYIPHLDRMFAYGGSLASTYSSCSSSNPPVSRTTWMFDFATKNWQKMNATGNIPWKREGMVTAYDSNTGNVFLHDGLYLYTYSYTTNSYKQLNNNTTGISYHMSAVIDPKRKHFYIFGGGQQWVYDIGAGSDYVLQNAATSQGQAIVNSPYPGLAYDPVGDRIIAWNGGDTVYSLNPGTRVWTAITYANGPGTASSTGTYKRWSYSPISDVFVLINGWRQDAYILRLRDGNSDRRDTIAPASPDDVTITTK